MGNIKENIKKNVSDAVQVKLEVMSGLSYVIDTKFAGAVLILISFLHFKI